MNFTMRYVEFKNKTNKKTKQKLSDPPFSCFPPSCGRDATTRQVADDVSFTVCILLTGHRLVSILKCTQLAKHIYAMSGNGRGNMRPTSRSPPFLVIGLLVAMCILAFNYWNLSSKNGDLSRQLETLQVDFRAVSDKHLTVEKRAADLASQLSESQTKQNQLQSSLAGKETKLSELNGEVETLRGQLQTATESLVSFFFPFVCFC